jgi:hypothetical protein
VPVEPAGKIVFPRETRTQGVAAVVLSDKNGYAGDFQQVGAATVNGGADGG